MLGELMISNTTISQLLDRAYGGRLAAVVPGLGDLNDLPSANPPAGVDETLEWLRKLVMQETEDTGPVWVFLVGGPGNGKSFQLVKLLESIGHNSSLDDAQGTAPRGSMIASSGARGLRVINDASIPSDKVDLDKGPGSLAVDLADARAEATIQPHVLVNINRGILLEEASRIRNDDTYEVESRVLRWLLEDNRPDAPPRHQESKACDIRRTSESDYFGSARLRSGESGFVLCKVSLDRLSLFEITPGGNAKSAVTGFGGSEFQAEPYKVMNLRDPSRRASPAGQLLSDLVNPQYFEDNACRDCAAQRLCPFLSNAVTLRTQQSYLGLLTLFRGAEIASGRLYTFRDLWSLLSTAIVGHWRPGWSSNSGAGEDSVPCGWVQNRVAQIANSEALEGDAIDAITQLAEHRLHNALFSSEVSGGAVSSSTDIETEADALSPALRSLSKVDPVIDTALEWAKEVNHSLEGANFSIWPGESLAKANDAFGAAWQEIDRLSEKVRLERSRTGTASSRDDDWRLSMSRVAHATYRQYAIANQRFAHDSVVEEWIELRKTAQTNTSATLMTKLGKAITSLLLPDCGIEDLEGRTLLPLFHARTEPVTRSWTTRTWSCVVDTARVRPKLHAFGDSVWVALQDPDNGREIAEVHVDLPMCREALASSSRGTGFTERAGDIAPKLERARASFIADGKDASPVVLAKAGASVMNVKVGTR